MPSRVARCLAPFPSCVRHCTLLPRAVRLPSAPFIPQGSCRQKYISPTIVRVRPPSRIFTKSSPTGSTGQRGPFNAHRPLHARGSIRCTLKETRNPLPSVASASREHDSHLHGTGGGASSPEVGSSSPEVGRSDGSEDSARVPVARGAYIHIPFCRRRCHYCDFPIDTVGMRDGSARVKSRMESYVDTVCREIRATPAFCTSGDLLRDGSVTVPQRGGEPWRAPRHASGLETVYFGGGTPSLLPPAQLRRILEALDDQFGVQYGVAEITAEMDPGTFDAQKLREFLDAGVNRVSVGVQSFSPALLKATGRSHTLDDTLRALELLRQAGVSNWSMDLISGLPGQTMEMWVETLEAAIAHAPPHISAYDLQIEPGTAFGVWSHRGKLHLPSDELAADMFVATSEVLRAAGYEHYEVSNYARAHEFRSRHNQLYWRCAPYHAFGNGAASYTFGKRFSRPRGLPEYIDWVDSYEASHGVLADVPEETLEDRLLDRVMLSLRTCKGLDMHAVRREFGNGVADSILEATCERVTSGHAEYLDDKGGVLKPCHTKQPAFSKEQLAWVAVLRLTDPHGLTVSNDVISSIFSVISSEEC